MNMPKITLAAFILLAGCLPLRIMAQRAGAPATFLMKPAALVQSKAAIAKHDPVKEKALAELKAAADQALEHEAYSVTFKSKTPPSGDKHDYMSVGPYWWPDSTKADGLPYVRHDGVINPERYAIKDDEYYNSLCGDVKVLGLAWYFTGDKKYADKAAKQLHTWFLDPATRMNPNLNFGQAIPGITKGRGIGLIDTHRVSELIDGIQLLKGSAALSDADYKGIREWYRQFLDWMRNSPIGKDEEDEKNNHGTWYDVQAVIMALFIQQPDLAKDMLVNVTEKRIDSQLKEDGSQPLELARTLSWNYSSYNLQAFFNLARLAENVKVDLWHYESPGKKSIRKAFEWMLPFAAGSSTWQHKQIKPMHADSYLGMAMVAEQQYPGLDLSALWQKHPKQPGYVFLLAGWAD
jgi:hypothetical protein